MDIVALRGVLPTGVMSEIDMVLRKYHINSTLRMAHFLAQCHHESGGFKAVREKLNYDWKALRRVFPKYFADDAIATDYAKQPERIANRIYANRIGNGPESSGDGFRYRGRGYIQLTGKANYAAFSGIVPEDCVEDPDVVATKYPLLSAAWFWNSRKLNTLADRGPDDSVVESITKVVNGGTHGLASRIQHFGEYYELLGGD